LQKNDLRSKISWLSSYSIIPFFLIVYLLSGCASSHYMLDDPVNDPIMFSDDQQDSDLAKVEDGGMTGSSGECPT